MQSSGLGLLLRGLVVRVLDCSLVVQNSATVEPVVLEFADEYHRNFEVLMDILLFVAMDQSSILDWVLAEME
jgi:hypothetical protein